MKSYFARLTARIAPQREAARPSMSAAKLHDPFEESGSPDTPLPLRTPLPGQTISTMQSVRSIAPVQNPEHVSTPLVGQNIETVPAKAKSPSEVSALTPKPLTAEEAGKTEDAASTSLAGRTDPTTRLTPKPPSFKPDDDVRPTDAHEAKPPVFESLKMPPAAFLGDAADPHSAKSADASESSEAILLRKADAFMKGLFERRASTEPGARPDAGSAPAVAEPLHPPARAPQRLVPAPVVRPAPKPEQPSLVIGKLTVEVVPQAPVAPPAKTERIIVKQSSGRAGGGVPSSRRFGLSRF